MPHAVDKSAAQEPEESEGAIRKSAGKVSKKAKENPKTAIAAGALVAGIVAAAAAVPLVRSARSKESGKKKSSGGTKKKKS
jgi:preprotein translocase subunit Sec61beta